VSTDETPVVLCVDDEPSILSAMRRVLIEQDWDVLYAKDANEGLRVFRQARPHLVLADFRMPGMDGVEFLKRTKEIDPDCMRIMLSGYADVKLVVSALNEGEIYRFLGKPWLDDELLDVLRKALAHRTAVLESRRLRQELEKEVADRTSELEQRNRSLRFVQAMLERLPMTFVGVDCDRTVVTANQAAREHFDAHGEGLVGVTIDEAFSPEVRDCIDGALRGEQTANTLTMSCAGITIGAIVWKEKSDVRSQTHRAVCR
jgi:two-component system NtrC family sensor kinase